MNALVLNPPSKVVKNVVRDLLYACWCKGKRIGGIRFPKTSVSDPAKIYNSSNIILKAIYLRRLKICFQLIKGNSQRTLELGTGSGILIPSLFKNSRQLIGLDIHKRLLEVKNALIDAKITNFELIQASAYQIPVQDNVFDSIIAISLLEHLPKVERVVKEARRVIKKNGSFIVGVPIENRATKLRHLYLAKKYGTNANFHITSYQDIFSAVRKYFRIVNIKKLVPFMPIAASMYCALECRPK